MTTPPMPADNIRASADYAQQQYGAPSHRRCPRYHSGIPHDAHDFMDLGTSTWSRCPGYDAPDEYAPEPAPPPTLSQQVRDLERVIERVREAVGTDAVLVSCDEHADRIATLESTLREVVSRFVHPGHPGEPCLQTGWIAVRTVERWNAVLNNQPTSQETSA